MVPIYQGFTRVPSDHRRRLNHASNPGRDLGKSPYTSAKQNRNERAGYIPARRTELSF
jgi:hypothetical protein